MSRCRRAPEALAGILSCAPAARGTQGQGCERRAKAGGGADEHPVRRGDAEVQAVIDEYREKLLFYYTEVNQIMAVKGKADSKLSMETWMDICRGYLTFTKRKGSKHMEKAKSTAKPGESGGLGEGAFVGDCTVMRESDITGDERCKEKLARDRALDGLARRSSV